MTNCILWDGGDEIWNDDGSTITITYSNVEGGWPGNGNIEADPLFVDPDGPDDDPDTWQDNDFHLAPTSPCIDAGDPGYVPEPDERDIDGQMRVWDGDDDGLSVVDMGSDEFGSYDPGDESFGGTLDLNELEDSDDGAILQGFKLNDLAGSSMTGIPDLNGDGASELVIASRFGKPYFIESDDVGFGEAYMIYGGAQRLHGVNQLNSVGGGSISGLVFAGIRNPLNTKWTQGLSGVCVVPDMDGEDLPEIVFGFPRVESVSLAEEDPTVQHPELRPDITGMGAYEYDAYYGDPASWHPNEAQFTRGGIVIVSSHNEMLTDPTQVSRKFDRVLDLHEIGQMFNFMSRASLAPYIREVRITDQGDADCDGDPNDAETPWIEVTRYWDVWLGGGCEPCWQGPGGFYMPWTTPPADPPLANWVAHRPLTGSGGFLDTSWYKEDPCEEPIGCVIDNYWYVWLPVLPLTSVSTPAWDVNGAVAWTGFFGGIDTGTPAWYPRGDELLPPTSVGARVLAQRVDDRFGTAVGSDGTWLYISAPERTALQEDVPMLPSDRPNSGVVYQLRTDARFAPDQPNMAQLWIEPDAAWPNIDEQIPNRTDYTMPVPHQYIIETVGSWRGSYDYQDRPYASDVDEQECVDPWEEMDAAGWARSVSPAEYAAGYPPYPPATAGYNTDRTPQIVGPHINAEIAFVRGLGDLNDDGVRDFAVGSDKIKDPETDEMVGAVYLVFGRSAGMEGDYLLEHLHLDPSDPDRIHGVLVKGSSPDEHLAHAFDNAGDFNGDGVDDVVIGNKRVSGEAGEAIVVPGSRTLESPANGWTFDGVVAAGRAFRFIGENLGDLAGANVAGAGDVDDDGCDDILIAAPGAEDGKGIVYLVYGSAGLSGDIQLAQIATPELPGWRYIGRGTGDALGGGEKTITDTDPGGGSTTAYSRGVAALGDIDGDGFDDIAISAMLADPYSRADAGEVYIIYGGPRGGGQTCPGDVDGDNDTDHSDLGALLGAWDSEPGDPNWNPNADLDGDGQVGHSDLGILLTDWGCGT